MRICPAIPRLAAVLALVFFTGHAMGQGTPAGAAPATLDLGDHSSAVITTKAWQAMRAKNYDETVAYTDACITAFGSKAVEMQKTLTAPLSKKEEVQALWALNDVGTCYFIKGQALEALGKKKEAVVAYKYLVDNLAYAQCWDPKGWFWKPADAAREKAKKLEFDSL